MTDLENLQRMFTRIGLAMVHKRNPGWATTDRIIISAADTRLCYSFDKDGNLMDISWGPWQDAV
jgi:hypothetical protein